jgi:FtsH-binding integral membrane protein
VITRKQIEGDGNVFKRRNIDTFAVQGKTSVLAKVFLALGCILAVVVIFEAATHLIGLEETLWGSLLAFAILCFGIAGIIYFFHRQFAKLDEILEQLEKEQDDTEGINDTQVP